MKSLGNILMKLCIQPNMFSDPYRLTRLDPVDASLILHEVELEMPSTPIIEK